MDRSTKYNYIEIVNKLVPELYRDVDFYRFGSEEDVSITFLGKILKAGIENDLYFTGINNLSGGTFTRNELIPYFVPKNQKTRITANSFSQKFLKPYGKSFDSFTTKQQLYDFFSGTFLPDAELNNPSGLHSVLSGAGFGAYSALSSVHNYLVENLGMFYFMNSSGLSSTALSSYASSLITDAVLDPIMSGLPATEKEAINTLFSYFWHNREDSVYAGSFIPVAYASATSAVSATTYASGVQLLDSIKIHLETWTDDRLEDHTFLSDSMDLLIGGGEYPKRMRDAGPFQRFLKAISLGIADISLILEEISDLLSIDDCPERFLDLLANNIGWVFLTGEYPKWRAQLHNAVLLYKTKGSMVGMTAAFKLIFPDGMFSVSDISEAWECYVPKLIYYLIKTESFIAKDDLWYERVERLFPGERPPVRFNQAPRSYVDSKDRNCRFMVDAVLEDMHNKFKTIKIQDVDFRSLPLWTCIPDGIAGGRGFRHRNYPKDNQSPPFNVAVPPWEKYGFYRETKFGADEINYLCDTLSGSREDFGFEVNEGYVASLRTLLDTALSSVYALSGVPTYAENNGFRFFLSAHQLPPNYTKYVEYGHTSALQDFDTWNTKSSHIFSVMELSTLDNTLTAYDTFRNRTALGVYVDVLREFIPLHVTAKIILYHDLEDDHCTKGVLCVVSKDCLNTFNLETLNSVRTDFWAGASGTGTFSSVVNEDGRVLPSPLSSVPFWNVSKTNLDRTASRRRNYRYSLGCYPFAREGKGMPIAVTHYPYATSASISALDEDQYLNTWEYILKGFDYNLQNYMPMSSTVWDASSYFSGTGPCEYSGTTFSSFDLSNTYPVRAVPDDPAECSALPYHRDSLSGILRVMTHRTIRDMGYELDEHWFSDLDYRTFEFGDSVHRNYHVYRDEFDGNLDDKTVSGYYNYGGDNFISYAYGPGVWNNDFRFKGTIIANTSALVHYGKNKPLIFNIYEAEWSSVIGGTNAGNSMYKTVSGNTVTLDDRTYFNNAPDAGSLSSMMGVFADVDSLGRQVYRTREILSGLELRQVEEECNNFVVVSTRNPSIHNTINDYAVTFYNQGVGKIELVVPFDPVASATPHYNKLRPQSKFRLDTFAKTAKEKVDQILVAELLTSGVLNDEGVEMTWGYNWGEDKWQPYSSLSKFRGGWVIRKDENCPRKNSLNFHTQDAFTEKSVPCGDIFKTGDVHTSSTSYILKIRNRTVTPVSDGIVEDGLTLYGISILDKTLNSGTNGFNSNDTYVIYKFWDTLSEGDFSRNPVAVYGSDPIFGTNGGSRAEYVELVGGDTIDASGTLTIGIAPKSIDLDWYEYIIED